MCKRTNKPQKSALFLTEKIICEISEKFHEKFVLFT